MKGRLAPKLFLGIPTVFLLALFVVPLLSMVVLSVWRTENYHIIADVNLNNYHVLATGGAYVTFLIRSLVMATAVSLICTMIAWPVAYAIILYGGRYRLLLTLAFAVPFLTGEVLRVIALQGLLGPLGLVNGVLMALGSAPLRAIMYTNVASAIGLVYLYLPIVVTVIYLSLLNFDQRLIDAAKIFGASPVRAFFEVTWPLNLFGTLIGFALCFIPCLSATLAPRFLGGPNGTLYGMAMAQQFGESGTWALGAAMGVVLFAVSILLVVLVGLTIDLRRTGFTGFGRG
ncbi:ABC transporter permease [Terrihabitans rhizophilus]|uniref:ABC transporter permease n=1 Tax=Terrihabitans rhizophilus TaxID=3092662 RepID=A0ABU4RJR8_9HYPH|nr:ABC transporter permease [Terrihabitans sp. PJ23]MDX6804806.1 ABC transporter permease [Terrihabitans sp. PJ23]